MDLVSLEIIFAMMLPTAKFIDHDSSVLTSGIPGQLVALSTPNECIDRNAMTSVRSRSCPVIQWC